MESTAEQRRRLAVLEQEVRRLRAELHPEARAEEIPTRLEALVAVVANSPLALPLDVVLEVIPRLPIVALPDAPPQLLGHMRWRGIHVPVLDLHFLWTGRNLAPSRLEDRLIVVRHEGGLLGLLAPEVLGVDHFEKDEWNVVRPETGGAQFALALAHRSEGEVLLISLARLAVEAPLPLGVVSAPAIAQEASPTS